MSRDRQIVTFNHPGALTFVRQRATYNALCCANIHRSIVGSVVECSPATRAARVRFPDDAESVFFFGEVNFSVKEETSVNAFIY